MLRPPMPQYKEVIPLRQSYEALNDNFESSPQMSYVAHNKKNIRISGKKGINVLIPEDMDLGRPITIEINLLRLKERRRFSLNRTTLFLVPLLFFHFLFIYCFAATVIVGMGFFADAYDVFPIFIVTKLLSFIYYEDGRKPDHPKPLPPMSMPP
ncbi:Inorganic phosphate transporter 1-1 [Nymphaea thermarum]|nr:Inorganic phosphate transporter 1-1 [Nymphaea thermarum]